MSGAGLWCQECPFCEQGRLFAHVDVGRGRLYLHCEECESGYPDPAAAQARTGWFQTAAEEFESRPATREDLRAAGWERWTWQEA